MPSNETLKKQAAFLGVPEPVYLSCSRLERGAAKARFVRKLRSEATQKKLDPDEHVAEKMQEFPEEEDLVKTSSSEIRKILKKKQAKARYRPSTEVIDDTGDDDEEEEDEEEDDEEVPIKRRGRPKGSKNRPKVSEAPPIPVKKKVNPERVLPYVDTEGVKVYHNMGDDPPQEEDPMRRDGPTVGPIEERERPPDFVGDRPPRTLTDLYARWPIAQDPQFFLRIERTKPKRWQGLDVAGFVGEIRGQTISEAEIQRRYGGQEYEITLYGPDPRGKVDSENRAIIKSLTNPITLTVPVIPPVPTALPMQDTAAATAMNNMNPFGPVMQAPTTTADANIHKSNTSLFQEVYKLNTAEQHRREQESMKMTSGIMSFMQNTQQSQLQTAEKEKERLDKQWQARYEELRAIHEREVSEQRKVWEQEKRDLLKKIEETAQTKDANHSEVLKIMEKLGPDKEAEVKRLGENYTQQMDTLRRSNEEHVRSLKERHDSDLKRAEERVKEVETNYRHLLEQERTQSRAMLENERSQWTHRESALREQMKEQTSNERTLSEQRVQDMKERHDAELRQIKDSYDREIRSLKESFDIRFTVSKETSNMTLQQAKDRQEQLQQEMERLREEMEEAKDLTLQLERAKQQAELLGYEKKDANEPKNALERFASMAGAGVGQMFSQANEWLPKALEARKQQQQQPQPQRALPQQQHPNMAAIRRPPVNRDRGVQWATAGVSTEEVSQPQGSVPSPVQPNPEPVQATETSSQQQPPAAAPQAAEQPAGANTLPEKYFKYFTPEAIFGFFQQSEQAVSLGMDASVFAEAMVGQFREGANTLVQHFTPTEVVETLKNFPGAEISPLLRRDGQRWLEQLWKELEKQLKATNKLEPEKAAE